MISEVASLRKEYVHATLDEDSVHKSPIDQFTKWFEEAIKAEINEPNAMVLATSDKKGFITQRTVLLKAFDKKGFVFYTNYKSRKAQQIDEHPHVSVLFPWYTLERQVAITGTVEKVSMAESEKKADGHNFMLQAVFSTVENNVHNSAF